MMNHLIIEGDPMDGEQETQQDELYIDGESLFAGKHNRQAATKKNKGLEHTRSKSTS
jgi:hypothetical protein